MKEYPELPDRTIARQLNVAHSFVGALRKELGLKIQLADNKFAYLEHPYIKENPQILDKLSERGLRAIRADGVVEKMAELGIGAIYAQEILNKERKAKRKSASYELTDGDIILKCDDLRNGLLWVEDNSIDLILCDPPYASDYIPLYKSIGELSERVLKPHGILLILTGQAHLNKIMYELDGVKGLRYNWLLSLVSVQGGSTLLHKRGVTPNFKPITMHTKEKYKGDIFSDVIIAEPPDKTREKYHKWEQDESAMATLIERFSDPGMTILDACCGSGTTGVSAVKLGRKFIGIDIDEKAVETACMRIAEAMTERETDNNK